MNKVGWSVSRSARWVAAGLVCSATIALGIPAAGITAATTSNAQAPVDDEAIAASDPTAPPAKWDLLSIANWFRAHVGGYDDGRRLPPLAWDQQRADTSQNEVDYLAYLRTVGSDYCGHDEDPDHPADRFGDRTHELLYCNVTSLSDAAEGWMALPLHANPFLNPISTGVGGARSDAASAAGFASNVDLVIDQPYVYPAPDGVMPRTDWLPGEQPDSSAQCPPTGEEPNGAPISIFMPKTATSGPYAGQYVEYIYQSHQLRSSDGTVMPSCFMSRADAVSTGQLTEQLHSFIFPRQPFENGQRYTASATLTPVYDHVKTGDPITLSWSFDVVDYRTPTGTRAQVLADGTVRVTWDGPTKPTKTTTVTIFYSSDGGKTSKSVAVPGSLPDGQVIVSGLPTGIKLRLRPGPDAPWSNEVTIPDYVAQPVGLTPVPPARLADTRAGSRTVDGRVAGTGRVGDKGVLRMLVAGRGGVPAGARAVVVNLTPVGVSGPGFVTAWSCEGVVPVSSSANYSPDDGINPNLALVPLNNKGEMCLYTLRAADLVVDVTAYASTGKGSALVSVAPQRLADTRTGAATVDGSVAGVGKIADGAVLRMPVAGRGGVPPGAEAAMVNLTPVGATSPGFVSAWSCDGATPLASSANYSPGDGPNPNVALVPLNDKGEMCVFALRSVDLVIDVTGYVAADGTSELTPVAPARLADTRQGTSTIDGQMAGAGRLADGGVLRIQVAGRGSVPVGADAAIVNLTPAGAAGLGFVTAWSCDGTTPLSSSANYSPADGVNPNLALVPLNSKGEMCVYTLRETDLVVDVSGFVAAK